MKKAVIYVFSGTGNTYISADMIKESLSLYSYDTTVYRVRTPFTDVPDPNGFDIEGFGYPVYAYNTPELFLDFVKSLPKVNDIPAFIFKTSGEPFYLNGVSSYPLIGILREKGFVLLSEYHFLMPYNILFRYTDALAKQMYLHTCDYARVAAEKIADKTKQSFRFPLWAVLISYIFRIQWLGAKINSPLIHVNKKLCIGCGLCEKTCPTHNIIMKDGYPHFSHSCTMCMSCAMRCPVDAVRPGLLSPVRVNGEYKFNKLVRDESIADTYINEDTKGYFRLFLPYYRRTNKEIEKLKAGEKDEQKTGKSDML